MTGRLLFSLATVMACIGLASISALNALVSKGREAQSPVEQNAKNAPPLACRISALSADQRRRHAEISRTMASELKEVRELEEGYALRFAPETSSILMLSEFISLERRCCPFFHFVLEVGNDEKPLWLKITGAGVKELLKQQLASLANK